MSEKTDNFQDVIRFVFWNVHKNQENIERIISFGKEYGVHIIALCEVPSGSAYMVNDLVYQRVQYVYDKIESGLELFIDRSVAPKMMHYYSENRRFNVLYFDEIDITLAIAHLNSNLTTNAEDCRRIDIREMLSVLQRLENAVTSKNTLIVGDLNMGLFDKEMLSQSGLNARLFQAHMVMSSKLHETVTDCFYNPMLNVYRDYAEDNVAKGTYYYENALEKWCCYDHVLMKFPLVERFVWERLQIVSTIGTQQLVINSKPVSKISDHLPIYFEIAKQGGKQNA